MSILYRQEFVNSRSTAPAASDGLELATVAGNLAVAAKFDLSLMVSESQERVRGTLV